MIYQSELTCILANITARVAAEAVAINYKEVGGYEVDWAPTQQKIMDYFVLSKWQQNDDGTTGGYDNYISQEEFDSLIDFVRTYAACVS